MRSYDISALAKPFTPCGPCDGFWLIEDYAALGDGRSVALVAPDGSVDWWCVPNLDSPPLFERMMHRAGGFFQLRPVESFTVRRRYHPDSNVMESVVTTASGKARITESLNSSLAGRLPWTEFARRVEGIRGHVKFALRLRLGTRGGRVSPWIQPNPNGAIFHIGSVLALLRRSDDVRILHEVDQSVEAEFTVKEGGRTLVAIQAADDEPLGIPLLTEIDERIETSDHAWREWAADVRYEGPYQSVVRRSALALKLLLYSSSGAIAAAATSSLPERIGGCKNWDYRYAWIRDAAYVTAAFLRIGAMPEAKAAFAWLMHRLNQHGPLVMYALSGEPVNDQVMLEEIEGYRHSTPVVIGNRASLQHQHGIYGDIFETASLFVSDGNILDQKSAKLLADLADRCADRWHEKDAGIWELTDRQHYTMSKISCWQALNRACALAEMGHIAKDCLPRWQREAQRIVEWIDENCWSETRQAYTFYPGTDKLDASLALAVPFGFDGKARMLSTLKAIRSELGRGPFLYRYSDMAEEEGAFLACTCWMVEGLTLLGHRKEAEKLFEDFLDALPQNCGIIAEMIDPATGQYLGNTPQGLSHLGIIHAACALAGRFQQTFNK